MTAKLHKFVRIPHVLDYLRSGWSPLPTLEGTHHEAWSVHCVWLCDCEPVYPDRQRETAVPIEG